jgi:LPPG:FO 2-phospho-L-lactate transferase
LIAALAGGVGAARFLSGVTSLFREEDLSVIVNTGDDIELFGLHISPDIDIVIYTLAGIVDEAKGWGIRGDTFRCLNMLQKHDLETWFGLGDRDLATHLYRTHRLRQGFTLTQITNEVCDVLRLKIKVLPMTNDKFETRVITRKGSMHFEEYFVREKARDEIQGIEFVGAATAKPSPGVLDTILNANTVVICPSNPIVSIGTILSVDGVRDALKRTNARVVGVSPIVDGLPIKGPADKMLRSSGVEVSAFGVAEFYSDFLDEFVIDVKDIREKNRIEKLGIKVKVTNTVMKCLEDRVALAKVVLED